MLVARTVLARGRVRHVDHDTVIAANKLIVLVGGCDKGEHLSPGRQSAEIELARARLRD